MERFELALAKRESLPDRDEERAIPFAASLTFSKASAVIFEHRHAFFENLAMKNKNSA